jgi:flagellar biosynthesis protein FliQ
VAGLAQLLRDGLSLALFGAAPALGVAFCVAAIAAGISAWTKLDDPALRALPRLVLCWLAVASCAGFVSIELVGYTRRVLDGLLELTR